MSSKQEMNKAVQEIERRYGALAVQHNALVVSNQMLTARIEQQAEKHAEERERLQATIATLHKKLSAQRRPWWRAAWIAARARLFGKRIEAPE